MAQKPDIVGLLLGLAVGAGVGIQLWRHFNPCPTCPTTVTSPPTETITLPSTPGHIYDVPAGGLRRLPRKVVMTCDMYGHCSPAVIGRSYDSPFAPIYTPTIVMQGEKYDRYGCYTPGGFQWCDTLKRCIRPWEQTCA